MRQAGARRRAPEPSQRGWHDNAGPVLPHYLAGKNYTNKPDRAINPLRNNKDMHTLDYERYQRTGVNITGLRMVDPAKQDTADVVGKWINWEMNAGKSANISEKTLIVTVILYLIDCALTCVFITSARSCFGLRWRSTPGESAARDGQEPRSDAQVLELRRCRFVVSRNQLGELHAQCKRFHLLFN